MLADMARYMHNDYSSLPSGYSAANFPHANMPNLFWWDWNANSGDTGGLVDNTWVTVRPLHKITHRLLIIRDQSLVLFPVINAVRPMVSSNGTTLVEVLDPLKGSLCACCVVSSLPCLAQSGSRQSSAL